MTRTDSLITISKSAIHGVGVFAERDISRGSLIAIMTLINVGNVIDFAELPTVGVVSDDGTIEVPLAGFPLWAVNYADRPNIAAEGKVIRALETIFAGTELTVAKYDKD